MFGLLLVGGLVLASILSNYSPGSMRYDIDPSTRTASKHHATIMILIGLVLLLAPYLLFNYVLTR